MSLRGAVLILLFLALGAVLSSCAEKKTPSIAEEYAAPSEYIFAVAYDAAWKGTVQAISEAERIKSLEKESGLIVTEFKTINNLIQNLVPTAMFGKIYKNGYTVHLSEVAPGQTRIRVRSNLTLMQLAVYTDDLHDASIEAYMRQELFRKICINLSPDALKCTSLFPDYHLVSVSCAVPSSTPEAGQPQILPQVAAKGVAIPVKQVQRALAHAGFEPGPIDGLMGKKTRAATARFQEDKGIEGTGTVDWATMQALGF